MKRRNKWLIAIGALVALIIATALVGRWYLHSRHPLTFIETAFSERMRGEAELHIGALNLIASDRIELTGITLAQRGGLLTPVPPPLARIERLIVTMDWFEANPTAIDIVGIDLTLDQARLKFLDRMLTIESEHAPEVSPRTRPRQPIFITAHGRASIPGVVEATAMSVHATATGPQVTARATGLLRALSATQSQPMAMTIRSFDTAGGQRAFNYAFEHGVAPAGTLVDAGVALGIFSEPGEQVRRWLPGLVDLSGSSLDNVPDAHTYAGAIRARWDGGEARTQLALNRRRLELNDLALNDPSLLRLDGRVVVDFAADTVTVTSQSWSPGPRLEIPDVVPVAGLRSELPRLEAVLSTLSGGPGPVVRLTNPGRGWMRLQDLRQDGLLITAADLPLELAQAFVPDWLAIHGGIVSDGSGGTALRVAISATGVTSALLTIRQVRVESQGWSIGPIDGQVRVEPHRHGWQVAVETRDGSGRWDGSLRWIPAMEGGQIDADLPRLASVIARLHGPTTLPDLRGSASGSIKLSREGRGQRFDLEGFVLRDFEIPELIRGADARGRCTVVAIPPSSGDGPGDWRFQVDGQFTAGTLLVPVIKDLNLGSRSPLVTLTGRITTEGPQRYAEIDRLAARSASPNGKPTADGWSAALAGRMRIDDGTGRLHGAFDRIDLGWMLARLPGATNVQLTGEGGCTMTVDLVRARPARIEGAILPLGSGFTMGSVISVQGVTGAIAFSLTP